MSVSSLHVHNNSECGLSLLEIVFAAGIVMMLFVTLASGATVAVRNATFARNEAQASKYAREEMELVRAYRDRRGFANFSCGTPTCYINTAGSWSAPSGLETIPGTIFNRSFAITTNTDCSAPNGKYVTVTVTWTQGSRSHSSTIDTCFTNWQTL